MFHFGNVRRLRGFAAIVGFLAFPLFSAHAGTSPELDFATVVRAFYLDIRRVPELRSAYAILEGDALHSEEQLVKLITKLETLDPVFAREFRSRLADVIRSYLTERDIRGQTRPRLEFDSTTQSWEIRSSNIQDFETDLLRKLLSQSIGFNLDRGKPRFNLSDMLAAKAYARYLGYVYFNKEVVPTEQVIDRAQIKGNWRRFDAQTTALEPLDLAWMLSKTYLELKLPNSAPRIAKLEIFARATANSQQKAPLRNPYGNTTKQIWSLSFRFQNRKTSADIVKLITTEWNRFLVEQNYSVPHPLKFEIVSAENAQMLPLNDGEALVKIKLPFCSEDGLMQFVFFWINRFELKFVDLNTLEIAEAEAEINTPNKKEIKSSTRSKAQKSRKANSDKSRLMYGGKRYRLARNAEFLPLSSEVIPALVSQVVNSRGKTNLFTVEFDYFGEKLKRHFAILFKGENWIVSLRADTEHLAQSLLPVLGLSKQDPHRLVSSHGSTIVPGLRWDLDGLARMVAEYSGLAKGPTLLEAPIPGNDVESFIRNLSLISSVSVLNDPQLDPCLHALNPSDHGP